MKILYGRPSYNIIPLSSYNMNSLPSGAVKVNLVKLVKDESS